MSGVRREASARPMLSGATIEWLPEFGVLWHRSGAREQKLPQQRMKLKRGLAAVDEKSPPVKRIEKFAGVLVAAQRRRQIRFDIGKKRGAQQQIPHLLSDAV